MIIKILAQTTKDEKLCLTMPIIQRGIVSSKFENGIFNIKRDIILGLNIPNYE